jgi:pumilio family protein 6
MELQPKWREMMESKYSKFLMGKLIRYCPSIRPLLVPVIAKNLGSLLSHADAVQPISDFYDLYASAKERRGLVRGFYPREVELFDGGKDGSDTAGLEGALEETSEAGRARVLEGVEKVVVEIFNATQKTALAQSIFHRLVYEYITCIYRFLPAETANTKMHELLDAALESLPEIVHTKDGSAAVRELLVRGNAKDRKGILQHLRKHVEAIAKDADAQLVLFTAFDVVDDTKLMGKAFVSDIVGLAHDLAHDKNGRRAVLYLLVPTASRHFLPSTLASLAASAQAARDIGTSKKDPAVRRREIAAAASPGLLALVAEHGEHLVRDPGAGLLVTEILLHTAGDKAAAIDALTAPLAAPFDDEHILTLPHATRTYKTLLGGGHFSQASKSIEVVDAGLGKAFAAAMWRAISADDAGGPTNAIKVAAGAPFVVVELLAALEGAALAEAKDVLGGSDALEAVEASEMKGANVLAERIKAL